VAELCDRVLVMYAGEVVEQARVADLFAAPSHPYTEGLLASVPRLDLDRGEPLYAIPGQVPPLTAMPSGCRFHPRCHYAVEACASAPIPLVATGSSLSRCIRTDAVGGLHRA
jgi:oligopeptide/dipeptide ABC transporter ATP-binding protein